MREAARIATTFGMDPVRVLSETDRLARQIRQASLMVVQRDQEQMWGGGD